MLDWSWLIQLSLLCVRCMYGCANCFGRFTKSQKLESRSTKDNLGQDKGEEVPLNNSLEISSSNEMENNGSNSRQQRSSSSVSANHRVSEIRPSAENDANSPYVNHALRMWTERRREWVGTRERPRPTQHREPVISWSTTYEDLLGTSRPFTQPVPLPEMVDFLVDVWEQEGLYEDFLILCPESNHSMELSIKPKAFNDDCDGRWRSSLGLCPVGMDTRAPEARNSLWVPFGGHRADIRIQADRHVTSSYKCTGLPDLYNFAHSRSAYMHGYFTGASELQQLSVSVGGL